MIDSPLKWHGGKHYLAPKLLDMARRVPHIHRVEVFGGSLAFTLMSDPEGYSEVVNDLDGDLTNFWQVLANPGLFDHFRRHVEATPFSEAAWQAAASWVGSGEAVQRAWAFFIRCRQSLAGRMDSFAPLSRTRTRRGMNEQASAWLTCIDGLPAVHARLKRVVVLNQDFRKVLSSQDGPQTLFYCDPPYVHETRSSTGEYGDFEMTFVDHEDLLKLLGELAGKFMLSGYRNELYDEAANCGGWHRHDWELPNNAAGGKNKRRMTECVWCNFSD